MLEPKINSGKFRKIKGKYRGEWSFDVNKLQKIPFSLFFA